MTSLLTKSNIHIMQPFHMKGVKKRMQTVSKCNNRPKDLEELYEQTMEKFYSDSKNFEKAYKDTIQKLYDDSKSIEAAYEYTVKQIYNPAIEPIIEELNETNTRMKSLNYRLDQMDSEMKYSIESIDYRLDQISVDVKYFIKLIEHFEEIYKYPQVYMDGVRETNDVY